MFAPCEPITVGITMALRDIGRAGAVIAGSGGMLSHSSIVARERGIPCVVSLPDALRLADGTMVHVDGFTGLVTVEQDRAA